MHFKVYSQYPHQHVPVGIASAVRVILQKYERTNVVTSLVVTPQKLKIIIISVKIVWVL